MKQFKKILILGSGALKIGEAGEFDYSGSQAIKALREEGIKTVLVNPNIATIQTSKFLADRVYFLPITHFFVEKIIEKEKPDGILLSFGGQTALNCGIDLYKNGILEKYNIKVLGTPVSAILLTEDREKFANHLKKIKMPVLNSFTVETVRSALERADEIGFPVMVRAGFALGGQGSGVARNLEELNKIATNALSFSPQILIERYLHHFKEIEYEVVRDTYDNCITVCNMENMDPMGIHTGESIVVAPSQTLTNSQYHELRAASIKIIRSFGIVGECNVQYALNPKLVNGKMEYYIIEVNARLSRSSALASKATGYPLAYVAAKLSLLKNLTSIKNKVTNTTQSCFEPALDYVVVKFPRWDIEKFRGAEEQIGSSMKSVGEVMGIGRTFEEALQKSIRMLDQGLEGITNGTNSEFNYPNPKRIFAIANALKKGVSIKRIYKITGIDPWFLYRIKNIVDWEAKLSKRKLRSIRKEELLNAKRLGFSDKKIGDHLGVLGLEVRKLRKKWNITPSVLQIDTLAGEFPAKTNYLYLTYGAAHDDIKPLKKDGVIVLGSGPYRIGSSVEFDWTSCNAILSLSEFNKKAIIVNCNPETVSTDYDISERLYFEELTFERIADIYEFENPHGIIVSVGGQTPNNRVNSLSKAGFKILGTKPKYIDIAEDRSKFSNLLDKLSIGQPVWSKFANLAEAEKFSEKVGYPVLIRPSYVLSGSAMNVCYNSTELQFYIKKAIVVSREFPITVSKFIDNAKEIEFDAVASRGEIVASILTEHVENAGVHSGDATIVLPSQKVYLETAKQSNMVAQKIAKALHISGPFNIQFIVKDNKVFVIEANLRSSRTFPFISKVTGVDFIKLAVAAIFNKTLKKVETNSLRSVAVKVPQFSFARITGADPLLHVEMTSTGEVACFGEDIEEAFLKGELAVGGRIPQKGIFISLGGDENKIKFLESLKLIKILNLPIYATEKTRAYMRKYNVKSKLLYKLHEGKSPNILDCLEEDKVDLAIFILEHHSSEEEKDHYKIRRTAIDYNIPLFTDIKKAELFIKALAEKDLKTLPIKSWDEYVNRSVV